MAKVRQHNEWFRLIKTRTCSCGQKKTDVYSWGEYRNASWRTIDYVCQHCFPAKAQQLLAHVKGCGCVVNLVGYRGALPDWIKLPEACPTAAA